MFGGVPISVVNPPSRDAKASGMRKRDGRSLLLFETLIATGIRRLTAPTLFMKAEKNAVIPDNDITRTVERSGTREYQAAITSTTPEF